MLCSGPWDVDAGYDAISDSAAAESDVADGERCRDPIAPELSDRSYSCPPAYVLGFDQYNSLKCCLDGLDGSIIDVKPGSDGPAGADGSISD
jgi:hypothetical protein